MQGVQLKENPTLIKIFQYAFPDSVTFNRNILDEKTKITRATEQYACNVLLLFAPYRAINHLKYENSYTKKLRRVFAKNQQHPKLSTFLQNLQDSKSNSFRYQVKEDDLQRCTKSYRFVKGEFTQSEITGEDEEIINEEEEYQNQLSNQQLDQIIDEYFNKHGENSEEDINENIKTFSFENIRMKGKNQCGYDFLAHVNKNISDDPLIEYSTSQNTQNQPQNDIQYGNNHQPSKKDIISILLTKTTKKTHKLGKNGTKNISQANGSVQSIIDWAVKYKLDPKQRRAFEIIIGSFLLTFYSSSNNIEELIEHTHRKPFNQNKKNLCKLVETKKRKSEQLICLLHGPGGSGKTTVINLVMEYAKEYCSYIPNFSFNARTITITALTGVAATLLKGETVHSALLLNQKKPIQEEQTEAWEQTRLLIIDEISFASKKDLEKIDQNLKYLKQQLYKPYGGLNIVFAGDYRQLEPVGAYQQPVYKEHCKELVDYTNCFIELDGMHCFKQDLQWGNLLMRFCNGKVTQQDIATINERVLKNEKQIPDDIKYCTYYNRDRDSINSALFEERCKYMYEKHGNVNDSILIFADNLMVQDSSKKFQPFKNMKYFWETCGEDDIKSSQHSSRLTPVLAIYTNCNVMIPKNIDVLKGQANGTEAIVKKVFLKENCKTFQVQLSGTNIYIKGVYASNVEKIILQHTNTNITPRKFEIIPQQNTFQARLPKPKTYPTQRINHQVVKMKATQLPILINNATTGHKLQGKTIE